MIKLSKLVHERVFKYEPNKLKRRIAQLQRILQSASPEERSAIQSQIDNHKFVLQNVQEDANSNTKYILWALPKGQTDRLHERPLTSFALTADQAKRVQDAASKDGWHSFRLVPDTNAPPDFTAGVKGKR